MFVYKCLTFDLSGDLCDIGPDTVYRQVIIVSGSDEKIFNLLCLLHGGGNFCCECILNFHFDLIPLQDFFKKNMPSLTDTKLKDRQGKQVLYSSRWNNIDTIEVFNDVIETIEKQMKARFSANRQLIPVDIFSCDE